MLKEAHVIFFLIDEEEWSHLRLIDTSILILLTVYTLVFEVD